jgi:ribosomal protein S27E
MKLVTIQTFDNSIDAHMMRMRFEDEGINCFIFDENIVNMNLLYNITVGGIKLKINYEDIEKAQLIIEEMNQSKLKNDNDEIIKCPKCQSDQLIYGFKSMKGTKGILSGIISFILIIFPIYYNTVNKCKDCGHEF